VWKERKNDKRCFPESAPLSNNLRFSKRARFFSVGFSRRLAYDLRTTCRQERPLSSAIRLSARDKRKTAMGRDATDLSPTSSPESGKSTFASRKWPFITEC
jgi:hypothetical protein